MKKSEIYKIRYWLYRQAGYSPKEARKLRSYELDIGNIKIKKSGKVPIYSKEFKRILKEVKYNKKTGINDLDLEIKQYKNMAKKVNTNDRVWSHWGLLTHDNKYKDYTSRIVKKIEKQHNLNEDQSFYFLYNITEHNMTYKEAREQLLTNKEFEIYISNKHKRSDNSRNHQKQMELLEKRIEKMMSKKKK